MKNTMSLIFQGFALWFDVFFPIVHHSSPKPRPTSNGSTGATCNSNNSSNGSSSHSNGTTNGASDTTHNHEELKIGQKRPLPPPSPTSTAAKYANGYSKCVVLSTSPYKPETHWKQSLLYLNDGCTVQQDSIIDAKVTLTPCKENKRFLNIALTCQVDDELPLSKSYFMGYEVPDSKRYHDSDDEDCIGGKPSP